MEGTVVKDRYEILGELGRGLSCVTWKARDRATGRPVVVKALRLEAARDWKGVELLEREAAAMRALDHPRIPRYVDFFQEGEGDAFRVCLVQEYIGGESLAALAAAGKRGTEEEVAGRLAQLLAILAYVHSLRPPLVHRDVNPNNVLLDSEGAVYLVDFSGVQDAIRRSSGFTNTAVGTAGYASVEQYMGRATEKSDLYGAAATALFLLAGRNPSELPMKGLKPDLDAAGIASPRLRRVLDDLLEPDPEKRTLDATAAIALLTGAVPAEGPEASSRAESAPAPFAPPAGCKLRVDDDGDALVIDVPPAANRKRLIPAAIFMGIWMSAIGRFSGAAGSMQGRMMVVPFAVVGALALTRIVRSLLRRARVEIKRGEGIRVIDRYGFRKIAASLDVDYVPFDRVSRAVVEDRATGGHGGFGGMMGRDTMGRDMMGGRMSRRGSARRRVELSLDGRRVAIGEDLGEADKQYLADLINAEVERELKGGGR